MMTLVIQLRRFPIKVLKVRPDFFLAAYNKTHEREKLREKLLNIRKPGPDDFGNSQSL